MSPTGTYRAADGRIVRMAYTPGIIPGATQAEGFDAGNDSSTIPAYPFVLVALLISAMIGALVFYRKRHLTREMQMYDEDGNPLGSSAYEESGYAPSGNMLEDGDGYNDDGTFDEYGDSLAGSQQPGGYATLEDDNYGDGGDGYGDDDGGYDDDGEYGDDGYNDGGDGGGGFDTIEEGNEEEDWGNEYGEEDENESQKQDDDEFSNQWE